MKDNNHTDHSTTISIDMNPLSSKAFMTAFTGGTSHDVTELCLQEIASSIHLNHTDLPFYAAALDILSTSIKCRLDKDDMKMYDQIMNTSKIFTLDGRLCTGTHNDHDTDHDTDTDSED